MTDLVLRLSITHSGRRLALEGGDPQQTFFKANTAACRCWKSTEKKDFIRVR